MMHPNAVIGRCPTCAVAISRDRLLFETRFEAGNGSISYATCPSCQEVVNPLPWGDS